MEHQVETGKVSPCEVARKLIAEGKADRGDRLIMLRNGRPALSGNIGWFADRSIRENDRVGLHYVRWMPFPVVPFRPGTASDAPEVE